MPIYECQDCRKQTSTPEADGWKQLVYKGPTITIKIVICADCAPKNGDNK